MKSLLTIVVVILALISSPLYAGKDTSVTVSIEFDVDENGVVLDSGRVTGNMWNARSSKNDVEAIGCFYRAIENEDGSVHKWGRCRAWDANEVTVVCYTFNPEMLDALQAITAFSYVRFWFTEPDPENNNIRYCTQFHISTRSIHLPEFTTKHVGYGGDD